MDVPGYVTRTALAAVCLTMVTFSFVGIGARADAQTTNTFTDDDGNIHESAIEFIAEAGVTKGCNPPTNDLYCPSQTVTRGQMAAFLVRALNLPETTDDFFTDDTGTTFEGDINRLAAAKITSGCNPPDNDLFCPDTDVSRGQMAAFLSRAFNLPDTNVDYFTDDATSVFQGDINRLAESGITFGCGANIYCPSLSVLRDQMASFLARALQQFPPTTTTTTTSTTTTTTTTSTTTTSTTTTTTTMPPASSIQIVKTGVFNDEDSDGLGDSGETISYSYVVTNTGSNTLTGLAVTDAFTAPASGANLTAITCAPVAQGGSLNAGQATSCAATYTIAQADVNQGSVVNTADADATSTTGPVNDSDGETVNLPQLSLVSQTSFGIYNDGTEAGATLIGGATNTAAVVAADTTFGVRIGVTNKGNVSRSVRPQLQYRYIDALTKVWSAWTPVTGTSARVRSSASASLTDGQATTERLAGPLTFVAGSVDEVDGLTNTAVSLLPARETEFLYSIRLVAADVLNTDQYELRVVDATSGVYGEYVTHPGVNIPYSFANGFDTGVNGNFISATDPGDPDQWSQVEPGGIARYDNSTTAQGPLSALFDRLSTDLPSYVRVNDFNQGQHLYGRVYFRYTGVPAPAGTRIVDVVGGYANGDAQSHSITVKNDGKLNIKAGGVPGGGDVEVNMTTILAPATWYRIEWHATTETITGFDPGNGKPIGAGDGTLEVRLYGPAGTLLETGTIAAGPTLTEFEDADFGPRSQTVTAWIDEVGMSNQTWLGP